MIIETNDNYTPGSAVEPELLLKYLIYKSEELSTKNYRGFPLHFRGFGIVALDAFPELYEEFLAITAPSEQSMSERANRCREILVEALDRPDEWESESKGETESDEDNQNSRGDRIIANRFAYAARREGDAMVDRNNFEFIQVWECMVHIALQTDTEKFQKFQDLCVQYTDPRARIEQVIPLLWEVVTRRRRNIQTSSKQTN